jgi:hypothetical protein
MKAFNWSGYCFDENRSSETEYIFVRTEIPGKHLRHTTLKVVSPHLGSIDL